MTERFVVPEPTVEQEQTVARLMVGNARPQTIVRAVLADVPALVRPEVERALNAAMQTGFRFNVSRAEWSSAYLASRFGVPEAREKETTVSSMEGISRGGPREWEGLTATATNTCNAEMAGSIGLIGCRFAFGHAGPHSFEFVTPSAPAEKPWTDAVEAVQSTYRPNAADTVAAARPEETGFAGLAAEVSVPRGLHRSAAPRVEEGTLWASPDGLKVWRKDKWEVSCAACACPRCAAERDFLRALAKMYAESHRRMSYNDPVVSAARRVLAEGKE